jgi:hypothetical protein
MLMEGRRSATSSLFNAKAQSTRRRKGRRLASLRLGFLCDFALKKIGVGTAVAAWIVGSLLIGDG